MRTYVFDSIYGVVGKVEASSVDEAIAKFKKSFPTRTFACVYEE